MEPNVEQKIFRGGLRGAGGGEQNENGAEGLKFSGESARNTPGARKSPKNGKPENNCPRPANSAGLFLTITIYYFNINSEVPLLLSPYF